MRFLTVIAVSVGLLIPLTASANGINQSVEKKKRKRVKVVQSSPQAVAKSFVESAKARDYKAMLACITDESKKRLVVGAMFMAAFSTGTDKVKKDSLEKLLMKHGIDQKKLRKPGDDPTAGVKDWGALFGALMNWIDQNNSNAKNDEKPSQRVLDQFSAAKLSGFKIDGDSATADVRLGTKFKSNDAKFKKVNGKWYIDFGMTKKR